MFCLTSRHGENILYLVYRILSFRSLKLFQCAIALSSCLVSVSSAAHPVLLDDTYVSNKAISKNFGNTPTLKIVADSSDGYLRFDLAGSIPAGAPALSKATLKLFVSNKKGLTGELGVYETTTDIEELLLNGSTMTMGTLIASKIPVKNKWVEFDVSEYVANHLADNAIAFALKGSTGLRVDIDSKENKATSHASALEITWANVSGFAGISNTAYGQNALTANTTGVYNTAFGLNALASNVRGNRNTALGESSLKANLDGLDNTATGFEALIVNTTGFSNTALGASSLALNTTGNMNTATGFSALNHNTTGIANSAHGTQALLQNTTGNYNTASGVQSLFYNTTGEANTAQGWLALFTNTTGTNNTASGSRALEFNSTGNDNTATGAQAMFKNDTGNNNAAFGFSSLHNNTTGNSNTALGYSVLANNTIGANNTAVGANALNLILEGSNNTAIGVSADVTEDLNNATAIGYAAKVNRSNMVRIGNVEVEVIEGQVAMTTPSDQRFKNQIKDIPLGLEFISRLRPVEYVRNNTQSQNKEWGLIAQELKQALQNSQYQNAGLVQEDNSANHYLTVRYNDLLAPMIKAIQEQQKTIDSLSKKIEALEKQQSSSSGK